MDRESEPLADLSFFESLDKVNRAMHGTNDLEQVMRDVLDVTLSVLGCDRAFLLYACDPDEPSWEIPMERAVPQYPGLYQLGVAMPANPQVTQLAKLLRSTDAPVEFEQLDPEAEPWKRFQVKSFLGIALYPKVGKPWAFGLHQCSYARRWTRGEKKLFQEISRRLADGLTSLLVYRDLQRSEQFLESIIENIPNLIFVKEAQTLSFVTINKACEQLLGRPRESLIGRSDYDLFDKELADAYRLRDRQALETGRMVDVAEETVRTDANGERIVHTKKIPVADETGTPKYLIGISEDITERKRLEEQLRQAQKMESIGRLAGGVAHDFNNMLGVIIGNAELALGQVHAESALHQRLQDIRKAAERSADLTHQLLAFARKQTVAPEVLDLNATLSGMIRMLRFLIGEHIELQWRPSEDLWPIRIDPSQVDQLLANLCVNARDAIADVGTIVIETHNVTIDPAYCTYHIEAIPGDFVMLSVSDDGSGMDKETLGKIFEPFFTTKELGKGTGLGLATVYGIIKQNGGFISVYSEPGVGTTFKLYFPRQAELPQRGAVSSAPPTVLHGHETILLVEDEPEILSMVERMLSGLGYRVLAVSTPSEAIRTAQEHRGEVHLLMTDVIMPEMNGSVLATHITALYAGIKCMYMSGYTDNVIASHGVLGEGVFFIQKPFSTASLAKKLREVLG